MSYLSRSNPDGWGVAWFNGREWRLFKEPLALHESRRARGIARSVRGMIIISHVRFATHGGRSVENTHPWLYRGFVFAHNGYLDREGLLGLVRREYRDFEGETDSEVLFHLLVQEALGSGGFVEGVKRTVGRIIEEGVDYSSLNFIASDGVKLYALRYARRSLDYYTLYYLERPREALHLDKLSSKTAQLIRMKLARGEKAILVASEPLTEEELLEIPNKRMLVIDGSLRTEVIDLS
jgi:glutamine amidotransferase